MKKKKIFNEDDDAYVLFTGIYYLEEELSLIGFFSSTFASNEQVVIDNNYISVYTVKNRYGYFLKLVAEKRTDVPPHYHRLRVQNSRYRAFGKEIENIHDIKKIVSMYDIALQSSLSNGEFNTPDSKFNIVNEDDVLKNEVMCQN